MSWELVRLEQICDINMGKTPSRDKPEYWGGNNTWVAISDLKGDTFISKTKEGITDLALKESGIKPVQKGTLLYSFKLSIGKVAITEKLLYTNEAIVALPIKDKQRVNLKYLYYAIQQVNLTGIGDKAVKGVTLNKEKLKQLPIPIPPLTIQKHIVDTLDKADALRRKDQLLLQKYDELAQSIFYDMFGDPVKNEKGWGVTNIRSIANRISDGPFGSNLKTEHYSDHGIRVIRLKNIGINTFDDEDSAFISIEHYESVLKKYTCYPGDILIGTLGEPNLRACMFPDHIDKAVNKADCIMLRINKAACNQLYISYLLNNTSFVESVANKLHGQTRTRISMSQVADLIIPIPPKSLQDKFSNIVRLIIKQQKCFDLSASYSNNLFQTLSQKAFSNEWHYE